MLTRRFVLALFFATAASTYSHADYAATVLEDKPFAYFRFEEPEGADELIDSSGNGNSGFEVIDVEFQREGVAGSKAAEFLGFSSIVTDLEFDPSLDGLNTWTIETWFNTNGIEEIEDPENPGEFIEVVKDQQVYISQKDGDGLGRSNMLISADRQPGSFIGGGTTNALDPFENDFVEPNRWYHFVMSANAEEDELYFFIDGEPVELNPQFPGNNGIEPATGEWVIGSHKNQGAQFFEGLLDEISFYDFVLSEERVKAHYDAATSGVETVPGDYDNSGARDPNDLDLQAAGIANNDASFDLDGDGDADATDRRIWIEELTNTYFGDSDFNGEFSSADFVKVFAAAKYESGLPATWEEGDWNGDGVFSSSDFVIAFSGAGYENGPRDGGIQAVPEPNGFLLMVLAFGFTVGGCRRRS